MATTSKTSPATTEEISFASLLGNAKSLSAATDDGYSLVDRETLVNQVLIIQKYAVQNDNGRKWSRIWALTSDANGQIRKVKFEDGGRSMNSITSTLEEMERLRTFGNIAVVLIGKEYSYTDMNTGVPETAVRYSLASYTG